MFFTIVLWGVSAAVFFSGRKNKVNIWCAMCFLITSIGTLKEFFMDSVVPHLLKLHPAVSESFYTGINSCLTAVLYLGTPYCFIMLAMYFSDTDKTHPKFFHAVRIMTGLIVVILTIRYAPVHYKYYQLQRRDFWYCMSAFNLGYGMFGSLLMIRSIRSEETDTVRRRKKLRMEVLIPPYYWWLCTIFIIHSLNFTKYMKVWKANRYLSLAVLVYYLLIIYREGIMGFRFRLVREPWNMDVDSVDRNTHYINHMIKNQASKIEWCVDILQQKVPAENQRELDIIRGASHQLLMFTSKTQEFLKTKVRASDRIRMSALIEKSLSRCEPDLKNIVISVSVDPDVILCCDSFGMEETFYNLFLNACEAMPEGGTITVAGGYRHLQWAYAVSVTDTGKGIPKNRILQIFTPFYTTKKEGVNYGLGLSFCRSILQAHNGKITVRSTLSSGTTFTLWFPLSRIRKNS